MPVDSESSADKKRVDELMKFTANFVFGRDQHYHDPVSEVKDCVKKPAIMHVELHKFFCKLPNYESGRSLTDVEHKAAHAKFSDKFGRGYEIKGLIFGYELFNDMSWGAGPNSEGRKDHMSAQDLARMMTTANRRLLDFGFEQKEIRVSSDVGGSY
jgi:hypothetical protein